MITKEKPAMSVPYAFRKAMGTGFEQALERVLAGV